MKMVESSPKGLETLREKEKLHEQFLLFLQCFQRMGLQTLKNKGLFGKGLRLKLYYTVKSKARKNYIHFSQFGLTKHLFLSFFVD